MKTPYAMLGKESLRRLEQSAANAHQVQRELLLSLLGQNKDTLYGKKYGFGEIGSRLAYQQQVPLTDYGDYDGYIQEMLAGAEQVLTAQAPVYYCISSGSTGGPKYLPVSQADLWVHYYGIYGAMLGMVQRHYPHLPQEALFGKILQTGEFVKTYTHRGVMNGIRSSALFQWLDRDGEFDASDYTVPKEVLFPTRLVDLTYVKARFALAQGDITAIHSVFIHHVTGLLQYIEANWEVLLADMELGRVDRRVPLEEPWRSKLAGWLPPNPQRAAELRQIPRETLADHMVQKLWRGTRYIMAIGGRAMARYAQQYARYAAGVPTHHFVYGSSEGMMAVANGVDNPDSYILLPGAGVFEFIPQDGGEAGEARPLFCDQVEVGQEYELVYTNLSGLYRYRMKDVLRIEGFYGQTPIVSFCYRKNQVLSISDEKTNTQQLEYAIAQLDKSTGLHITDYCVQEDFSVSPGRYLVYVECQGRGGQAAAQALERCLCQANYGYGGCRSMEQIGPAKLAYLRPGAFERYKQRLAQKGCAMGQSKPVRVLASQESRQFFLLEVEGERGEVV